MVTFQMLRDLRTEQLTLIADNFERLQKALSGDREQTMSQVVSPLTEAWTGLDADAAKNDLSQSAAKLDAARNEAGAVVVTLRDAVQELTAAKSRLDKAIEDAVGENFKVAYDGAISWEKPSGTAGLDDYLFNQPDRKARAEQLKGEFTRAIQEATEADSRAAGVLRQDADFGNPTEFNPGALGSGPVADAQRAQGLALRLESLSPTELQLLTSLVSGNATNPQFAETFLRGTGPGGLVDLTGRLAQLDASIRGTGKGNDPRLPNLKQIQTDLGVTLGTASPALAKDKVWMEQLKKAGEKFGPVGAKTPPGQVNVYGYQLLGVTMNNGNYDPEFLGKVASDIADFERKEGRPLVWQRTLSPDPPFNLNMTDKPGTGFDPMTSVMRQVSNNPAVATQFFKTTNPDNLKYMLFDRQGLEAAPLSTVLPEMTKVDAKALRDAAGDAFQAGVTGMNPNDPNAKYVPHNPEQQKLFERSLEMLASSGDKVPEHLRDNTAKVLANYGDQVHTSMSSESQGDGVLDRKQLLEVTRQVSRDPESYSVLNAAMNQWIIQDISSSTTGDIGTLDNAGQTIGFLEEARYQAREMDKEDFAEDPNRKLGIQILDAATAQLPYGAGDVVGIFTGTVIDGWQRDEQNRIDDNFKETSTANFEGREQQLKELAKAWEEVNSEHPLPNSQSNPETRIQEAADAGINRAASLGGKQT